MGMPGARKFDVVIYGPHGRRTVTQLANSEREAEDRIRKKFDLPDTIRVEARNKNVFAASGKKWRNAQPGNGNGPPASPTDARDGEVVRAARALLGWRQEQLISITRLKQREISDLENGRANASIKTVVFGILGSQGIDLEGLSKVIEKLREHRAKHPKPNGRQKSPG